VIIATTAVVKLARIHHKVEPPRNPKSQKPSALALSHLDSTERKRQGGYY
jgi:hypothetical protein